MAFQDKNENDENGTSQEPSSEIGNGALNAGNLQESIPDSLLSSQFKKSNEVRERNFSFKKLLSPFFVQEKVPVTWALILINLLVFVAMVAMTDFRTLIFPAESTLIDWGSNFGPLTLNGDYWRIFTALFIHIGFLHLLLNLYVLWDFGSLAERVFGSYYYLILYILAGLGGGCGTVLLMPYMDSAGASGAIFGVVGGVIGVIIARRNEISEVAFRIVRIFVIFLIVVTALLGLFIRIDNCAHFGGFVTGLICGYFFRKEFKFWRPLFALVLAALIAGLFKFAETVPFDFDGTYCEVHCLYLVSNNRGNEALRVAENRINRNPESAIGYRVKGAVLNSLFLGDQAIDCYTRAIELEPTNANLYASRSNSYVLEGMPEPALKDCEKAAELGMNNPELLNSQMLACIELQKYDSALDICNQLLKLDPGRELQYLLNRATIYRKMNNYSEALLDLDSILESDSNDIRSLIGRAYIYFIQGRVKEAQQEIRKAEAVTKVKDEYGYLSRAYAALAFDRFDQAVSDSNIYLEKFKHKQDNLIYSALVGRQAAQFKNDQKEIEKIDQETADFMPKSRWPYPILEYCQGKISEEKLLEIAGKNSNKLTECKTFIGIDYEIKDNFEAASKNYSWVVDKGNPFYLEFDIAQIRLLRLKESGINQTQED